MNWWTAGGPLMPVISLAGMVLVTVLAERALALHHRIAAGPDRAHELAGLLVADPGDTARAIAAGETLELTRGLWLARVLCAVLPLLGLIGTVAGMSGTFAALAADPTAMRPAGAGVSTALITTQYALTLAILGLIAEAWLRRRARQLGDDFAAAVAAARSGR